MGQCQPGFDGPAQLIDVEGNREGSDLSDNEIPLDELQNKLQLSRHKVFGPHRRCGFNDHYRIDRAIGEGSYGLVFEAVTRSDEMISKTLTQVKERHVAVKCFHTVSTEDGEEVFQRKLIAQRQSFERERSLLARLEHPHIVKMYECFEEKEKLWIILELCRGGELYERIVEQCKENGGFGFDEKQGRLYFQQMLQAVGYLHAHQVLHRDVKSENFLLLDKPGTPQGHIVKLCDFGTAVQLGEKQRRAMERIGTLSYTAPEIYARNGAGLAADAWSLGAVLYVVLVGASPFRLKGEQSKEDIVKRIQSGRFDQSRGGWNRLSTDAQDIIKRFLTVDEAERLNAFDALRHPWLCPVVQPTLCLTGSTPDEVIKERRPTPLDDFRDDASTLFHLLSSFGRLDSVQHLVLTLCARVTPDSFFHGCLKGALNWYKLFLVLDSDQDGRLSHEELGAGLHILKADTCDWANQPVSSLVQALDVDGSGWIDWDEWASLALLSVEHTSDDVSKLICVFRLLDRPSGDGVIDVCDLALLHDNDKNGNSLSQVQLQGQVRSLLRCRVPRNRRRRKHELNGLPEPVCMEFDDILKVLESIWLCTNALAQEAVVLPGPELSKSQDQTHCCALLQCCSGSGVDGTAIR